jgi:hypothetical protein
VDQRHRQLAEFRNDLRSRNLFRPAFRQLLLSLAKNAHICYVELNDRADSFGAFLVSALRDFRTLLGRIAGLHAPRNVIPWAVMPVLDTRNVQRACAAGCGSRTKRVCTQCHLACCGAPACALVLHNNVLNFRQCGNM